MYMKTLFIAVLAALLAVVPASAEGTPTLKMLSTRTCPACSMMSKVLDEIDAKYAGKLATEHVYLEEHPEAAEQHNVRYVPTLIFLDANGKEVATEVGYRSLDEVVEVFKKAGVNL